MHIFSLYRPRKSIYVDYVSIQKICSGEDGRQDAFESKKNLYKNCTKHQFLSEINKTFTQFRQKKNKVHKKIAKENRLSLLHFVRRAI